MSSATVWLWRNCSTSRCPSGPSTSAVSLSLHSLWGGGWGGGVFVFVCNYCLHLIVMMGNGFLEEFKPAAAWKASCRASCSGNAASHSYGPTSFQSDLLWEMPAAAGGVLHPTPTLEPGSIEFQLLHLIVTVPQAFSLTSTSVVCWNPDHLLWGKPAEARGVAPCRARAPS